MLAVRASKSPLVGALFLSLCHPAATFNSGEWRQEMADQGVHERNMNQCVPAAVAALGVLAEKTHDDVSD
jgi:hypothetical protein